MLYSEGDAINDIFILEKGLAGYYLTRYRSFFAAVEPGDVYGHIDFRMALKRKNDDEVTQNSEDDDETQSTERFAHESTSDEDMNNRKPKRMRTKIGGIKLRNPKWCRMFTLRTVHACELVTL